jgi:hypothetical protein
MPPSCSSPPEERVAPKGGSLAEEVFLAPYKLSCPTGAFVTGVNIREGPYIFDESVPSGVTDAIAAVGPIECSDGSKVGTKEPLTVGQQDWNNRAQEGEGYSSITLRAGQVVDAISLETTDGEVTSFFCLAFGSRVQPVMQLKRQAGSRLSAPGSQSLCSPAPYCRPTPCRCCHCVRVCTLRAAGRAQPGGGFFGGTGGNDPTTLKCPEGFWITGLYGQTIGSTVVTVGLICRKAQRTQDSSGLERVSQRIG